jgi:hypothetical protein
VFKKMNGVVSCHKENASTSVVSSAIEKTRTPRDSRRCTTFLIGRSPSPHCWRASKLPLLEFPRASPADETAATVGGTPASQSSALDGYVEPDGSQHVNFIDANGHIHELFRNPGSTALWMDNDLTALAGTSTTAFIGSGLDGYVEPDGRQYVNFIDDNGDVHELYTSLDPTAQWVDIDLTKNAFNETTATVGGTPAVRRPNNLDGYSQADGSRHVNFIDGTGYVHELYTQTAVPPVATKAELFYYKPASQYARLAGMTAQPTGETAFQTIIRQHSFSLSVLCCLYNTSGTSAGAVPPAQPSTFDGLMDYVQTAGNLSGVGSLFLTFWNDAALSGHKAQTTRALQLWTEAIAATPVSDVQDTLFYDRSKAALYVLSPNSLQWTMALTGHTERMKMRSGANGCSIFSYLHMSR